MGGLRAANRVLLQWFCLTILDSFLHIKPKLSKSLYFQFKANLATLKENLPNIKPRWLVLTHMSDDMLDRLPDVPFEVAEDGKVLDV